MGRVYEGETVEQCLEMASKDLGIAAHDIDYEIVKEKRGLFTKKVTISVAIKEENKSKSYDGTIKVQDGKISIKNPSSGGKPASIVVPEHVKIIVDGNEAHGRIYLKEENNVEVIFEERDASRNINISMGNNDMEAYISIEYIPKITYILKDITESNEAFLETTEKEKVYPPKFSSQDIIDELKKSNVTYGVKEEKISECIENGCKNVFIAKGDMPEDGKDDILECKFNLDSSNKIFAKDDNGNIDYKSIGEVKPAVKGTTLAVRVPGYEGKDGRDIKGKIIKHKPGKKIKLKAGKGCILKDENTVEAAASGKPCVKNNAFCVNEVYEIKNDVDLETGNIKFIGDIIIYGNVKEDMKVESDNSILIYKNIERSNIISKGDIEIRGSAISSNVTGGGKDVIKLNILENLNLLYDNFKSLIDVIEQIDEYNLLGKDKSDGEIIKGLIETKFKAIPRISLKIITLLKIQNESNTEDELIDLLKRKIIGLAPINIKHYNELYGILDCIKKKIEFTEASLSLPVDVKINYCQDSNIQSSGDIVFTGKGEYVSNITSNKKIVFSQAKSIARGGILKAGEEIKCSIVGSPSSVPTTLTVDSKGHIWADRVYINTKFLIGGREYIFDAPYKDVHAYLDDDYDITIDKILL